MTPLNGLSDHHTGRYPQNTRQARETNIHALSGIRNRDPSNRAAADLRVRPHGRWNQLPGPYSVLIAREPVLYGTINLLRVF